MRSCEKTEEQTYSGAREPSYNILSYTWGRFATDGGQHALKIDGVLWDVPKIDPSHFTTTQFQRIISDLTGPTISNEEADDSRQKAHANDCKPETKKKRVEHLWLDVACINQGLQSKMPASGWRRSTSKA
jgi:hypothetical protein